VNNTGTKKGSVTK